MAIGFTSHNLQREKLKYFEDSAILKVAKECYLGRYTAGQIRQSAQVMESNKILAAYTLALRLHDPNKIKFNKVQKFHADAFEAYIRAYYLVYGESQTCKYLKDLMIPLFDLIIEKLQNYPKDPHIVASNYFSIDWIFLKKLLDIEPNNSTALSDRGLIYYLIGKYEESLVDLNKSLRVKPDNLVTLGIRGLVYQKTGRYEESLTDLNKLLEINPKNSIALYNGGTVLLNHTTGVQRQYRKLDIYPSIAIKNSPPCCYSKIAQEKLFLVKKSGSYANF
ncbi:hypothetical protein C2G38_2198718 [Gigaspora rosea]|uniref:Uncharacterized protein n=1 Tax=Gigaspora rosea TaxID=44941 RepID=A0A397UTG4_9GLOM|nr:hypothetical protein C2G38_2198718 [Gigaspora rosea]